MNRLYLDLETSPNVVLSWRVGWDIKIDCDNIIKERAIICAGYKWEGDKEASCIFWDKNQNDKVIIEKVVKLLEEADEVVMHNGDKFDLPWVMARAAFHGLVLPPVKTIDTLQWARRKFNFNSNKLDYIAKYLGIGGKIKTEFGLWKEICLNYNHRALASMVDYCKRDVELLEKVYVRLAQFTAPKTHVGVLHGGEKWSSPLDGSTNVVFSKKKVTAAGTIQYQMQCKTTGKYYSINHAAHEAYKEWRAEKAKKEKKQ